MTQTEDIFEIPDATFIANESGRVTVFLPEFDGEPDAPRLVLTDSHAALFYRTPETACVLSNLHDETLDLLKKSSRCLVVELDLEKILSIIEEIQDAFDESAFKRVYETVVVKEK